MTEDPICGTCGEVFGGTSLTAAILGWGFWQGTTESGNAATYVICRNCRTEGRKRQQPPEKTYEDEPLF